MPIHEQTVYPNRNKFTIPNVCKTVNTTKAEGVSKLSYSKKITKRACQNSLILKKSHKALTFTSQGFAMSKSCCNFRP